MNKLSTAICCTVIALTAGCFTGDRAGTVKQLSIKLPTQIAGSRPDHLAGSPDTDEAVRLIGSVVVPYGLLRDTNAPAKGDLVAYFHSEFAICYCKVYLRDDAITVNLFEAGKGHGSKDFKNMTESLRNTLVGRYGANQVRIVNVN